MVYRFKISIQKYILLLNFEIYISVRLEVDTQYFWSNKRTETLVCYTKIERTVSKFNLNIHKVN